MKRWVIWVLGLIWMLPAISSAAVSDDEFIRGLVYFHMDDIPNARVHLEKYFRLVPRPQIRQGYMLLLEGKDWDATRRFKSYLDINHRSAKALVGIALSTRGAKNSTTLDNLERAIRLHPGFAPASLSLGFQYMTRGNYPTAKAHLERALSLSGVAEVKILLAKLKIQNKEPQEAEVLVREEADRYPDNFHFNYLTAWAMVDAGHIDSAKDYIQTAVELAPDHRNLNILRARYFYARKQYREALLILNKLKFKEFSEDYLKIHVRVLMALKDHRRARPLLYRLFRELPWNAEVNLLMGEYCIHFSKGDPEKALHWKRRALWSGSTAGEMEQVWPGMETPSPLNRMRFFAVRKLCWAGADHLFMVGQQRSGEGERLYGVDPVKNRITGSLGYRGRFIDFHTPKVDGPIFFSTAEVGGEKTYLYHLTGSGSRFRASLLTPRPLPFPSLILGVNHNSTLITVTDARLEKLAFESPFSITSQYGSKTSLYPNCPFSVFMLNTRSRRWSTLKSSQMLDTVPIPAWKRYRLVQQALRESRKIERMITRGQGFDISSPEVVRVIPAEDGHTVLVYMADLENSFKGVIFDTENKREISCDQSMFLGEKSFADVDVRGFSPRHNRIFFVTHDRDREAILYDYVTRLYQVMGYGIVDTLILSDWRDLFLLRERGNRLHATETRLSHVHLSPYIKKDFSSLGNITRLLDGTLIDGINVLTYDGEMMGIGEDGTAEYRGISLEGALHAISPEGKWIAAFINGHLLLTLSR